MLVSVGYFLGDDYGDLEIFVFIVVKRFGVRTGSFVIGRFVLGEGRRAFTYRGEGERSVDVGVGGEFLGEIFE